MVEFTVSWRCTRIVDIAHNCDPSIQITLKVHADERVLEVIVAEGHNKPYRCRDGFFIRQGPSAQKLKRNDIIALMNTAPRHHFDETLNDRCQFPKDVSNKALKAYLKQCNINTTLTNKEILLNLNVAAEEKSAFMLRQAGVLFFAKEPQTFLAESYITAICYRSNDRLDVLDKKDFMGDPITQIEATLAFMQRHMNVAIAITSTQVGALGAREDVYDYPMVALQEAVVNAVVHRDYFYDASHIYVHMYPNYIDSENPGGLFHGLTVEALGKRSVRRNRLIADLLHRAEYIERIGSGFTRMQHALLKNNNPPLEVSATNFFNIRFYKRLFSEIEGELTLRQLQLFRILQARGRMTKQDIVIALNVSADKALREIKVLLDKKLAKRTGIGKATVYVLI